MLAPVPIPSPRIRPPEPRTPLPLYRGDFPSLLELLRKALSKTGEDIPVSASDPTTVAQAILDRAAKAPNPAAGNLAALDASGNPVDSGKKPSDFQAKLTFDTTPTAGSQNPVTSGGIKQAIDAATPSDYDQVRSQVSQNASDIGAIEEKIPPQASAQNQLADKDFVNSSIATNTATFRGTYNLVTDLGLTTSATHEQVAAAVKTKLAALSITPDHNDYCFVQVPRTDAEPTVIARIDRYKCSVEDGVASWDYEWSLNNSSFTANQWAAINSGITSALVEKLGALPTAQELAAALAGKASTADATLTPIYGGNGDRFSDWVVVPDYDGLLSVKWCDTEEYGTGWFLWDNNADNYVSWEAKGNSQSTNLSWTEQIDSDYTATATRTENLIIGYTLGSQSDKPLQPKGDYAPATNIAKSALASDVQASLGKADTALQTTGGTMMGPLIVDGHGPDGDIWLSFKRDNDAIGMVFHLNYISYYDLDFALPRSAGTLALTAGTGHAGNLAALDADGNPVDSGAALANIAPLASPAFTGTPTAPTPASGDNSTNIATTAFVQTAISSISVTPLSGQTFDFATTQGVMDALKTVIEALGGTVVNAPSLTISQGE